MLERIRKVEELENEEIMEEEVVETETKKEGFLSKAIGVGKKVAKPVGAIALIGAAAVVGFIAGQKKSDGEVECDFEDAVEIDFDEVEEEFGAVESEE